MHFILANVLAHFLLLGVAEIFLACLNEWKVS